jgi:hypothetical protein
MWSLKSADTFSRKHPQAFWNSTLPQQVLGASCIRGNELTAEKYRENVNPQVVNYKQTLQFHASPVLTDSKDIQTFHAIFGWSAYIAHILCEKAEKEAGK